MGSESADYQPTTYEPKNTANYGNDVDSAAGWFYDAGHQARANNNPWSDNVMQDSRQKQSDFGQTLLDAAMGNTKSAAEIQMEQGLAQNQARAQGLAASMNGVNPMAAARMAQQSSGQQGVAMVGQEAALRAQEQAQARQLYNNYIGQMRSQDLNQYSQVSALNNNMIQFYLNQGSDLQKARLQAAMTMDQLRTQQEISNNTLLGNQAIANSRQGSLGQSMLGGGLNFLGNLGMKGLGMLGGGGGGGAGQNQIGFIGGEGGSDYADAETSAETQTGAEAGDEEINYD